MKSWMLLGYVAVEIAAFWAMVHFLGWAWAIVISVAVWAVGFAVLGRRARAIVEDARTPAPEGATPGRTLTDGALFAGAALLTALPGVVSTLGALIVLAPPIRNRLRPVVAAEGKRRVNVFAERVTLVTMNPRGYVDGSVIGEQRAEGTVVDAAVVDTTVRNPDGTIHADIPALPPVDPSTGGTPRR